MIAGFMIHAVCITYPGISGQAVLTCMQLHQFKLSRKDTNLLVNRLIKLVIETGCATGTAAQRSALALTMTHY